MTEYEYHPSHRWVLLGVLAGLVCVLFTPAIGGVASHLMALILAAAAVAVYFQEVQHRKDNRAALFLAVSLLVLAIATEFSTWPIAYRMERSLGFTSIPKEVWERPKDDLIVLPFGDVEVRRFREWWKVVYFSSFLASIVSMCFAFPERARYLLRLVQAEITRDEKTQGAHIGDLEYQRKVLELRTAIAQIGKESSTSPTLGTAPPAAPPSTQDKIAAVGEEYKSSLKAIESADFLSEKERDGLKKAAERQMKSAMNEIITEGRK